MSATLDPQTQLSPESDFDLAAETGLETAADGGIDVVNAELPIDRDTILRSFWPENLRWGNVQWTVVAWMTLLHVGALAAPFYFSWTAVGVALLLHWFTCSIGICLCYHRALSHRSLKLRGPGKFLGLYAAAVAGEGSPLRWTMVHRIHHGHSDHPGDPHSPLEGKWWSHLLWMFVHQDVEIEKVAYRRYVPDLMKDRTVMFFEKTWHLWMFGTAALLYYFGGLPMLLWAVCARIVFAYHSTWFVNSATHLWGYRNYQTTDESRNLWWVAVLSYGEGWHNNHHAHPRLARAGHRWWEFDPTWVAISVLRTLGLATDVDDRVPKRAA
jgi:stearoyl-CoA desaturase (delta-9 desaturase)